MKKLLTLALSLTLCCGALTLAACKKDEPAPQSSSSAPASESSSESSSDAVGSSESSATNSDEVSSDIVTP